MGASASVADDAGRTSAHHAAAMEHPQYLALFAKSWMRPLLETRNVGERTAMDISIKAGRVEQARRPWPVRGAAAHPFV